MPDTIAALRTRLGRPLALAATAPPAWHDAAGDDARTYAIRDDLQPDPGSLRAVSAGAAVVLPWPFGRPPDPAAVAAVEAAGGEVVEDRSHALLATIPPRDGWVLLAPGATFDVGPCGVLVAPAGAEPVDGGGVADAARFAVCFLADLPGARRDAARAAAAWTAAVGARCPWSHWPLGTVPHRYPVRVADAPAVAAALVDRGRAGGGGRRRPRRAAVPGRRRRRGRGGARAARGVGFDVMPDPETEELRLEQIKRERESTPAPASPSSRPRSAPHERRAERGGLPQGEARRAR